jgi:signal transduction histidine kinase
LDIVSVLLAKTLRSSTFKMALINIAVFGAIVLALLGYVYLSTAAYVRNGSDRAITSELALLRRVYAKAGRQGLIAAIGQRVADERLDGDVYLFADSAFAPLAGNLSAWPPELTLPQRLDSFLAPSTNSGNRPLLRAMYEKLPDGEHLLVGKNISDLQELARNINIALVSSLALLLVLAGVASVMVTRRTVGRIEAINATSRNIIHSGLDKRIPVRGTHDEWDQVAENLNLMLDRIEILMGEVKQATDNVAHDLRTPLARMRGRLEKAYAAPRNGERDGALIGDTIADLDAVLGIFAALVRISQIEARDPTSAFRTVDLAAVAEEVVELFEAAAEKEGTHLAFVAEQRVLVAGDRNLLFDAMANLLDNAIKHGREAGSVTVEVSMADTEAVISVADDGPGIPVEQHQHVFKRFYRLERGRRAPGNGLGLSLVAAIARVHGARIEMLDNSPGLRFRLLFPVAA